MTEQPETFPMKTFLRRLVLLLSCITLLLWAGWVSRAIMQPQTPKIVTVRLAETIGQFVEAEARSAADPQATKTNIGVFLHASEMAVEDMGRDGRIILVAEAVLAGDAPDATPELERRIAARLKAGDGR